MIYGLKIQDSYYICDTTERFAPSYGEVSEQRAFGCCLEEYVQVDGNASLPSVNYPWLFFKGDSREQIEQGEGTLVVSFNCSTPEKLWETVSWINGGNCVVIRVMTDY